MRRGSSVFRALLGIAGVCSGAAAPLLAGTITLGTLLDEMIDSDRLTRLPEHPYRLLHASSYDRRSVQPHTVNWFANTDWSNYVRAETVDGRLEYVLLDTDGPGAIVRFWATVMGSGNLLRIYIDGSATPLIEGTLTQIVGRGAWVGAPLSFLAPFSTGTGTGHNLYLPIPFIRHCKVTVSTPSSRLYYNIDYRIYDTGAEVESFATNALSLYGAEYSRTQSALASGHPEGLASQECGRMEGLVTWGGAKRSLTVKGPSAVRLLSFKLSAPDLEQALRSTHLEIDFDDETNAVHCPIGDFFGTGGVMTTGRTWFVETSADGLMQAYWTMPFEKRMTVRVVNHGRQTIDIRRGEVWTGGYTWQTNSMHFHAAWRDYPFEDTVQLKGEDLNYVTLQGQGRLVGDTLSLFNDASAVPNSYLNWWGEGDEKITVDDEAFPSHFGTGTEDYYGYAWCLPQTFSTPFVAQPLGSGNDRSGRTVNTRMRLLDDIPYRSGLRFDMELLAWQTGRHRFAPTVFWYARPGGVCLTPEPLAASQLPVPRVTSGLETAAAVCPIGVRMELESMTVLQNTGGAVSSVASNGLGLSGEQCLRWRDCAVGSRVDFGFPASFTGQCALAVRVVAGPSSGTLRLSVNGHVAAQGIELCAATVRPALLQLDRHVLPGGINTLTVEVTAAPAGGGECDFALDYLENAGPYYVSRALPVLRERLECECLPVVVTGGEISICSNGVWQGSGAGALWAGALVGASARFQIERADPSHVPLTAILMCATNGARCDISVNGVTVCRGVELCREASLITNVFLGVHALMPGINEVELQVVGCAEGLDAASLSVGLDGVDIGSFYALNQERQMVSPLTGPCDDADGDGLDNLAEYAFGGDPEHADGTELWPAPSVLQGGGLTVPVISYRRRKPDSVLPVLGTEGVDLLVDGLVYQVQETTALGKEICWVTTNAFGPTVMSLGRPDDDNGVTVRARVRTVQPLASGHPHTRFMRVGLREP